MKNFTSDRPIDLAAERVRLTRLARAQADELEAKNAQMRGDLITVDQFHALETDALEHVKVKLLAVCETVAPLVIGKTEAEAERIIYDAIYAALDELADEADAAMADDGPANDPQPAA